MILVLGLLVSFDQLRHFGSCAHGLDQDDVTVAAVMPASVPSIVVFPTVWL